MKTLTNTLLIAAIAFAFTSCERKKEKVIDIQTPGGSIKVEQDKKSGEVDIQIDKEK
jgi:hypothetical protein